MCFIPVMDTFFNNNKPKQLKFRVIIYLLISMNMYVT